MFLGGGRESGGRFSCWSGTIQGELVSSLGDGKSAGGDWTAMAAQARLGGRFLGGRPPYGYKFADAGPRPNTANADRCHGQADIRRNLAYFDHDCDLPVRGRGRTGTDTARRPRRHGPRAGTATTVHPAQQQHRHDVTYLPDQLTLNSIGPRPGSMAIGTCLSADTAS